MSNLKNDNIQTDKILNTGISNNHANDQNIHVIYSMHIMVLILKIIIFIIIHNAKTSTTTNTNNILYIYIYTL